MVVLAATMLLYGGRTLVEGLRVVRDPQTLTRDIVPNVARSPAVDQAVDKLKPILDGIFERHRRGLLIDGAASIAYGLFTLFAVAAVLSRDRNGRRLALLTAVFGIAYQLGELPLSLAIAREVVAAGGPLFMEIGQAAGRSQAELTAALQAITLRSPLLTAVGVAWSLLLLLYFGGRHGRDLYGLSRS
jgi:hypothetical protein